MITEKMLDGLMAMRANVPAKDYAVSTAFYERIGFSVWPLGEGLAHVQLGDSDGQFCFLLQDAYAKEWAENAFVILTVNDLDRWWAHISGLGLDAEFGVAAPQPPRMEPWGLRVAYFHDPSGVCWHVSHQDDFPEGD